MYIILIFEAVLLSSLIEYLLHRFFLHRSVDVDHIKKHHIQFKGHLNYSDPNSLYIDIISGYTYILFNMLPYTIVSIYLCFSHISYGLVFFFSGFLYTIWIEVVHFIFHHSLNSRFESFKFFKRLNLHHKLHHSYYVINYGIGSRHWDFLFRTIRKH